MELTDWLREARDVLTAQGYTCAYLAIYGSQNYGLALDTLDYRSDVDVKCAVLPSLSQLAREESVPPVTLDWRGGQIDVKDARRFVEVAMRMNPAYLETLVTPHALALCPAFETVRAQVQPLLERDPAGFLQACCGMGRQKVKALCHPYPAAMEKLRRFGYDGKQAHHLYRLLLVMRAFCETGRYVLEPPASERDFLLALKRNELPLDRVQALTADWLAQMETICAEHGGRSRGPGGPGKRMKRAVCEAIEAHAREEALLSAVPAVDHAQAEDTWPTL